MTEMVGGDGEAQKNFWGVQWGQGGVTHEVIEVKYPVPAHPSIAHYLSLLLIYEIMFIRFFKFFSTHTRRIWNDFNPLFLKCLELFSRMNL